LTDFDFILTYQFPAFAVEMRNTKHQSNKLNIFYLLKWNKYQKCERPNETTTRGNKP